MTTTTIPRSVLRHRPIAPDVEEFVVRSPRASRGKRHSEAHTTGGLPSWKKCGTHIQEKRRHPLLFIGAGMLVTVMLLWVGLSVAAWVTGILDEVQYGYPRTTQADHDVGHGQGQAASHFVAINTHGQVYILEIPGGKPSAAQLLVGPRLIGPGADLAPVTLSFVGDEHHADLVVRVKDVQVRYRNTGTSYAPAG